MRSRHEDDAFNWQDSLVDRSIDELGLERARRVPQNDKDKDFKKFSYPHYFLSEDYHLAESRNDTHSNL